MHSSDIHLEPSVHGLRVRFRIDGVLIDQPLLAYEVMAQIISRLKVLAHIDIAEKRTAQDGKFTIQVEGNTIDLRVSTFPSLWGQKIVIRILDRHAQMISLEDLGVSDTTLEEFKSLLTRPYGFILVTGPTGSGKTTTLYASLTALHTPEKNIVTLEDPIEYSLEGITQGPINPDAGFTFELGIRSILRQDPDVIMVGEIRDRQTARIAIEAALTGHVVLSTLHTNDSTSAIMRLMDMGIEPFLINAAVSGVLAQRLVRKNCLHCLAASAPTSQEENWLKKIGIEIKELYKGIGCIACNFVGYKGRTGIFELLILTSSLRAGIVTHPLFDDLYKVARAQGLSTLLDDATSKLKMGIINLHELMRVII